MKKKERNIILSLACLLLSACDQGRIYPEEIQGATGRKATINIAVKGMDAWPENYMLLFAAFGDNKEMPSVSKNIPKPSSENETVSVTLNGLDNKEKTLSVIVANQSRMAIYNVYTYTISENDPEITLPVDTINLAAFNRIQTQVFDAYCTACHGDGNHAAAGLYLNKKNSHRALVNVNADLSAEQKMLVKPGKPNNSFLLDILESDIVKYNHTDVLPEKELIQLIKTWINEGAPE